MSTITPAAAVTGRIDSEDVVSGGRRAGRRPWSTFFKDPNKALGTLQVFIGATMISFSPVFVKVAHVGPAAAVFYRGFFGGLILLALVVFRRKKLWPGFGPFLLAVGCGFLFTLDVSCWHQSVHFVGPGLSVILANFQVFFLSAYGIFILREKPTFRFLVSIPLSFFGLMLLIGFEWRGLDPAYRAGILFGLLAAVFYAAYILGTRRAQAAQDSLSPQANMALISLSIAFFAAFEVPLLGEGFLIPDAPSWAAMIGYGFFGQVLGSALIMKGLPKIEASRAGLILLAQPALAFTWDVLFFGRSATPLELTGALLALTAIYLGMTSRKT